ncbi:universal stress protein [Nocardia sp. NEAU-G5]|uniref:Universal stress protein n=1 Tax=Nocardia albiluteola TaxID=2842303 RepID=A0ABS6AYU8_9NOCA|nr:universal stress protein [Nocardia albiluteola]
MTEESAPNERKAPIVAAVDGSIVAYHVAAWAAAEAIWHGWTPEPAIPYLIAWSRPARMVVVGSRGPGALRRGLLGSVSEAVTHHAQCPVAVVHRSVTDPVSAVQSNERIRS